MSSRSLLVDNPENFKILVATDIHLGFEEKNLVRGKKILNHYFYYCIKFFIIFVLYMSQCPILVCKLM